MGMRADCMVALRCQACQADLHELCSNQYSLSKRVCAKHLQADIVDLPGQAAPHRFCHQCGKFELLTLFDGKRRSCRARLQQRRRTYHAQRAADGLPAAAGGRRCSNSTSSAESVPKATASQDAASSGDLLPALSAPAAVPADALAAAPAPAAPAAVTGVTMGDELQAVLQRELYGCAAVAGGSSDDDAIDFDEINEAAFAQVLDMLLQQEMLQQQQQCAGGSSIGGSSCSTGGGSSSLPPATMSSISPSPSQIGAAPGADQLPYTFGPTSCRIGSPAAAAAAAGVATQRGRLALSPWPAFGSKVPGYDALPAAAAAAGGLTGADGYTAATGNNNAMQATSGAIAGLGAPAPVLAAPPPAAPAAAPAPAVAAGMMPSQLWPEPARFTSGTQAQYLAPQAIQHRLNVLRRGLAAAHEALEELREVGGFGPGSTEDGHSDASGRTHA